MMAYSMSRVIVAARSRCKVSVREVFGKLQQFNTQRSFEKTAGRREQCTFYHLYYNQQIWYCKCHSKQNAKENRVPNFKGSLEIVVSTRSVLKQ